MENRLRIIVDCVMYGLQPYGGIPRIFNEILPRICNLDDSLRIELLETIQPKQRLPTHSHISQRSIPIVQRYLRPGRLWKPIIPGIEHLVEKIWIGDGKGQIWHSTYFTLPFKWKGASVVTVYDMIYEKFPKWTYHPGREQILERKKRCITSADAIICISKTTCQDMLDFYNVNPDKVYVIHPAPSYIFKPLNNEDNLIKLPITKPFLLYVGYRAPYKNFGGLIDAYTVWSMRKEIGLIVVGMDWTPDEQTQLLRKGIAEDIILLNNVDDQTLCYLYNQASALVHPSFYEGFGIPIIEAMACGCPVITSHIPSTVEIAGDIPIYFNPTKIDDMLTAFDIALSEGRNSKRVQTGLEWIKRYSWDKTAKQTLEVYKSLAERNSL